MRKQSVVMTGMIIVVLLTLSSVAVYYRNQAVHFQREYTAAMARLEQMAAAPVTPEPASPREADADNLPPPRPDPAPYVAENDEAIPLEVVTLPPRPADPERPNRRASDWMENFRTNDPQRYAEFQQRIQDRQQAMENSWLQATNYFLNRDTSRMTPSDLQEYHTMMTLLDQAWSLNQQLQQGDLPPDTRQQVVTDLRSNIVAVAPLLISERNREYYDTARAMGQSAENAAIMVNSINQITSNTTLHAILPGLRLRGGMRGGRP